MTNSKDPLGQDALIAEASRWFAAVDAGTASKDAFEAWRAVPAHAVAYARLVARWEEIGANPLPEEGSTRTSRRQWLKAAAVGLPVAILASGFVTQRAFAWNSATTGIGETRRIPLPDGSIAYLNTDSILSWRFRREERALRLERGEVALDMRQGGPAILHANNTIFPLKSGLFDARITQDEAELTLIDGVAMPMPGARSTVMLRPKDAVIVDDGQSPRIETRSPEQVASLIAWRAGEIVFLDQSVAEAAADFNRHLTRKIMVGDAALAREKIGGRFDLARPDQFLKAVSLSFDARVVDTATGYQLTR
jgi:transmembrane sensor